MDPVTSIGRLVLSLGLIVAVLLVVRHWAARGRGRVGSGGGITLLGRTALTRASVVAIIETDGRRFLVGSADQGVRLLSELEPRPVEGALPEVATGAPLRSSSVPARRSAPRRFTPATDGGTSQHTARPRIGLLDRLRAMTVRTHVDRPSRALLR